MTPIAYFAGLNLLMKDTTNGTVRRCRKIWKQIVIEKQLKFYAEMEYKWSEWLRDQEIM